MTTAEIKALQRGMNAFVAKYLRGLGPILVDGELGPSTYGRINTIKYYLGYTGDINGTPNMDFRQRLYHPKSVKYSTPGRIARGASRRSRERRAHTKSVKSAPSHGVVTYDGRLVAAWMVPYLQWARQHGWSGTLVSGWRDPKYSRQLCMSMCGAPSCPGRCAGLSSNHVGSEKPKGATDVSDYQRFGRLMHQCPLRPMLINRLGAKDPVHYSASGG